MFLRYRKKECQNNAKRRDLIHVSITLYLIASFSLSFSLSLSLSIYLSLSLYIYICTNIYGYMSTCVCTSVHILHSKACGYGSTNVWQQLIIICLEDFRRLASKCGNVLEFQTIGNADVSLRWQILLVSHDNSQYLSLRSADPLWEMHQFIHLCRHVTSAFILICSKIIINHIIHSI